MKSTEWKIKKINDIKNLALEVEMNAKPSKRRQCQIGRCNKNKTRDVCFVCQNSICGVCTAIVRKICVKCCYD